jgi:hypothetical protein
MCFADCGAGSPPGVVCLFCFIFVFSVWGEIRWFGFRMGRSLLACGAWNFWQSWQTPIGNSCFAWFRLIDLADRTLGGVNSPESSTRFCRGLDKLLQSVTLRELPTRISIGELCKVKQSHEGLPVGC